MTRERARFTGRWEDEVCRLLAELESGRYRPEPYHDFTIHEPKERVVAAAPMRNRVVRHALVQVLEALFEPRFIEDSFADAKELRGHRYARMRGRSKVQEQCLMAACAQNIKKMALRLGGRPLGSESDGKKSFPGDQEPPRALKEICSGLWKNQGLRCHAIPA